MRANADELERRARMVRKLLAVGLGHGEITAIGAKAWGLGRLQMWRYIKRVSAEWQKLGEEESPHLRVLAIEQRNAIFRRALAEGKLREALRALDRRDELLGLFERRVDAKATDETRLLELIRESLESEGLATGNEGGGVREVMSDEG